jgi:hypothetical protein
MTKPTVFVASSIEGIPIAKALTEHLENDAFVKIWSEGVFSPGKFILESLDAEASRADFAIFILTPDDLITSREVGQSSANYLFELGFFLGKIGLSRTFLIAPNKPNLILPSDLLGVAITHFDLENEVDLITALEPASRLIKGAIYKLQKREERPIDYYSCFISYSYQDNEFAGKLYDDLQQVGVRCRLDAKDLRIGEPWKQQIERAIQIHEKVLLVLSHSSVESVWVRNEIENARKLEQVSGKTLLFPIRLDDSIFGVHSIPPLERIKEKQIGDFRNWRNQKDYRRAFSRLLRDLMISTSVETKEAV